MNDSIKLTIVLTYNEARSEGRYSDDYCTEGVESGTQKVVVLKQTKSV